MSTQGDNLSTAATSFLSISPSPPRLSTDTDTTHAANIRRDLVKQFEALDGMTNSLRTLVTALYNLIPVIDAPTPLAKPLPPRAITITASTSTTVSFSWTQDGTGVDSWYAKVVLASATSPILPDYTVTTAALAVTGLTAGTAYRLELQSHSTGGTSDPVIYAFQTSTGTARIVNTDSTTKSAARSAALSATNGTRNATFTSTDVSQLTVTGKQHLVIEDRSAGTPDRYVEEVVCTTDGTAISIPVGTLVTALATTRSTMADPWISIRKPGSSTRRIAVPLNNGTLSGNITLSGDIAAGALLTRGTLKLLMPPVSFDTQSATSNVEALITDMTTQNELTMYPDTYTNADASERVGGIYAYVSVALRPGLSTFGGDYPGNFAGGILSTSAYANSSFRLQPWGWIGMPNRKIGFQSTGLTNTATNTRSQVRNMTLYSLGMDNAWTLVTSDTMSTHPINNGSWYSSSRTQVIQYPGAGSTLYDGKDETANGGGMSLGGIGYDTGTASNDRYGNAAYVTDPSSIYYNQRMTNWKNWNWHFYAAQMASRSVADMVSNVRGFVISFEARKILHNPAGTDDRALCPQIVMTGSDWYAPDNAGEHLHSRFKFLPDNGDWLRCGGTDIEPSILRANPPPNYRGT